eukprot:11705149-Karenia_brevis.AAC.1
MRAYAALLLETHIVDWSRKTLARQFQDEFRHAAMPSNFGLADRSGTDGLIHMARSLLETDPSRLVL